MWIYALLGFGYLIYLFVKKLGEKPLPSNSRLDWDKFYDDAEKGLSTKQLHDGIKKGKYWTTEPAWYQLPVDTVVNVKKYEEEKATYGEHYAEWRRQTGAYRYK